MTINKITPVDSRSDFFPGTLSKPSIWADPGPTINMGTRVTIWCQGSQQTEGYRLYKEGSFLRIMTLRNPRDARGHVSIPFVDTHDAGQYQCAHHSSGGPSELSDPLFLTVTGVYTVAQTSLSALPSSVVASGGHVSLRCGSQHTVDTLYLLKEGGTDPPWKMKPNHSADWFEALFPLGPVNSSQGGTYRCYGSHVSSIRVWLSPSDPLDLQVTSLYAKPSLSAQPDPPVLIGDSLTLTCGSETGFHSFALTRDEPPPLLPYILRSQQSPNFTLGPVDRSTAGQYRCYYSGHDRYLWSAPSDPLDVLVAGYFEKPSLLARPSPTMTSGEIMTLQCRSEGPMDTFHLFKEGHTRPLQHHHEQNSGGSLQVNFTLSPVTSAHTGTYRCYSSHSTSPYLLSHPSDLLVVTGISEDQVPTVLRSKTLPVHTVSGKWQDTQLWHHWGGLGHGSTTVFFHNLRDPCPPRNKFHGAAKCLSAKCLSVPTRTPPLGSMQMLYHLHLLAPQHKLDTDLPLIAHTPGLPTYLKVLLGDLGVHVLLLFLILLLLLFIQHKHQRKHSK
ncbi:PREDICTED: leukocyte immunoglobulin-like receptor subfamily A member 6-like [Elephantulus edwardii]|uniref:leukocyte immunoglobulin-like receptor subfamily A member 6-like n=1 Tax=Elephantulus edwardii TaxID=28737 RepID=UPI0003F0A014|nr:PREDICTED: leukocyte immunoglobulin-like receptor subfamily A member 6-like [Elephantulus edwardii]